MAWVSALIDAVDAHRIDNRLSAAAAAPRPRTPTGPGAARVHEDQHRADVFVATSWPARRASTTTPPTPTAAPTVTGSDLRARRRLP